MDKLRIMAEGKFLRLVMQGSWEFAQRTHPQAPVGIVALTDDDKLLLVEQFRVPVGRTVIEIPAGLVGDKPGHENEDLAAAAKRELLEETGYSAQAIEYLTEGPSSAGMSNENVRLVWAHGLSKVGAGGGDGTEQITLHEISLAQVDRWLADRLAGGTPIDPKVYAGLYFVQRRGE